MADLLNYRKEDSDMNYNINEQKLGFDRVLPWEGQVPALVKEGEHYFLQVKAPEAENVTFTMNEEEFPCTREDDGIWRMEYTLRTGIQYVQLKKTITHTSLSWMIAAGQWRAVARPQSSICSV